MKYILLLVLALLPFTTSTAQTNLSFLGKEVYNSDLSDVWGYAANNREYALVGLRNGFSIVDVTDPANPAKLHFVQGATTTWRDVKTWGNYAYVTNEGGDGLLIVDLSGLPGQISTTQWTGGNLNLETAHNIFIDENGIAYIVGSNVGVGGAIFLDLNNNPTNPTVLGTYDTRYIHDVYVRNDTMWSAEINDGIFSVVDVSDKSNPQVMATQSTPSSQTHNLWLTDDGKTLLTTDEISNAVMASYDVTDLSNISELDRYQSSPGQNVVIHNVFIKDDFAVISYYRDGVVILDITYPDNVIEVGNFDTSPLSGSGFNGCWGVYPYLPSGNIIAVDIEQGLFVLGPTYTKAAYLNGTVTDKNSGNTLNDVTVTIQGTTTTSTTDITGQYKTGILTPGSYTIEYTKAGYLPHIEQNVVLQQNQQTTVDVVMEPSVRFTLTGTVKDSITGQGIAGAEVLFENENTSFSAITNANGGYAIPFFETNNYTAIAGKWGHITSGRSVTIITAGSTVDFVLQPGYYDDFVFDFDWNVTGDAFTGKWERDVPFGTDFSGEPSNPDTDVFTDISDKAYITGNDGSGAGDDDVDDGTTILTSPIFDLRNYVNPKLSYYRWFFNEGGSGTPDDELVVKLSNGQSTVTVETLDYFDFDANEWRKNQFMVNDLITPTATMQLIVETSDLSGNGHIVEAGFDVFSVTDSIPANAPVVNFSASITEGCSGEQVSFTDQSTKNPTSWEWTFQGGTPPNSTQRNPSVLYATPGTYTVTLRASNASGTVPLVKSDYIVINPTPDLGVSIDNVSCNGGNDGGVTLSANGAFTPYVYIWNNNATTPGLSNLSGGSYGYTATNAKNCSVSSSIFVGEPLAITVAANITNTQCGVAAGTIASQVSGGTAPYSYNWSTGDTTNAITNILAGTYTLTVTDDNNCQFSRSLSVSNTDGAEIFFNTNHVECPEDADGSITLNIVGGTSPYTYNWSTGATSQNISSLSGDIYTVTVTDNSSCISIQDIEILEPDTFAISIVNSNPTCGDDNGNLFTSVSGGTGPYTYAWSNSESTAVIGDLAPGNYNLTLTDDNGCTATATTSLVAQTSPILAAQISSASCKGKADGSVDLSIQGGQAPFQVLWSDGSTDPTRAGIPSGSYSVSVVDVNQCLTFTSIHVPADDSIEVNPNTTTVSGFGKSDGSVTVTISGGISPFIIGLDNGSVYSTTNNQFTIDSLPVDSYVLSVLDDNGCETQVSFNIENVSAIASPLAYLGVEVYPNPFYEQIQVHYSATANETGEFFIYDILGKQVGQFSLPAGDVINWGEDAEAGIYFIITKGHATAIKVIKTK